MPSELARDHSKLVAEAQEIFLVEVSGSRSVVAVTGAKQPVEYTLEVLAVIKGQARDSVPILGEGDLSGIWDTTFSDHSESEFWASRSGRMGVQGSCEMVPPVFTIGRRYLVMLGGQPDSKQYERIDSDRDRWLQYVRNHVHSFPKHP